VSANHPLLSNAIWDSLSDVDRAALLLIATDVEERGRTWPDAPDQIDPRKVAVLYDGMPIQSLLWSTTAESPTHSDPRLSEPTLAALVAIDRATRAILDPFELREKIAKLNPVDVAKLIERGREQIRDRADVLSLRDILDQPDEPTDSLSEADDQDYLAFAPATIAPGEVRQVLAQPCDPFVARRLAVTLPQEIARALTISMSAGRDQCILDRVSAETFVVRVPRDPREPIKRGARIRATRLWPSIPMVLSIENRSINPVEFSAVLRGRSLT
jgi:hypothetical protein